MSASHKVKCDFCKKTTNMEWNGEHWFHPKGWAQIWDDEKGMLVDEHICASCRPKPKKQSQIKERK